VINPAQFVQALNRAAGVSTITSSPVTRLQVEKDSKIGVIGERLTVLAERVLLNTNAYSLLLHPFFAGKVRPCRGQIQVSAPSPMIFRQAGYSHFGYWYFRQIPLATDPSLGRWLIGGGRHLHFATENDTFDEAISEPVQTDLQSYTARYFPEVAAVPITHRWAGTMGFTPDGLPLVGTLPDLPNVTFCVGFNGHGMGLGVMVVKRALALSNNGTDPGIFTVTRLDN
jgi:glycine/D-amino acid oxidase-like deaminating enzyme